MLNKFIILLLLCITSDITLASRHALEEWLSFLRGIDKDDYFPPNSTKFNQDFGVFINKLSNIKQDSGTMLNFFSVGACDGTADDDMIDKFIRTPHWRGVFVEALGLNVEDLKAKLTTSGNSITRATVLHVAAVNKCESDFIGFERPLYEELKGKKVPHWLRRQIGSVTTRDTASSSEWTVEQVRCMTGRDILLEAGEQGLMMNPHFVKVDVEKGTADAVESFINDSIPNHKLPWIVYFEDKMMTDETFNALATKLKNRGYIVSRKRQHDSAAILSPDAFRRKKINLQ